MADLSRYDDKIVALECGLGEPALCNEDERKWIEALPNAQRKYVHFYRDLKNSDGVVNEDYGVIAFLLGELKPIFIENEDIFDTFIARETEHEIAGLNDLANQKTELKGKIFITPDDLTDDEYDNWMSAPIRRLRDITYGMNGNSDDFHTLTGLMNECKTDILSHDTNDFQAICELINCYWVIEREITRIDRNIKWIATSGIIDRALKRIIVLKNKRDRGIKKLEKKLADLDALFNGIYTINKLVNRNADITQLLKNYIHKSDKKLNAMIQEFNLNIDIAKYYWKLYYENKKLKKGPKTISVYGDLKQIRGKGYQVSSPTLRKRTAKRFGVTERRVRDVLHNKDKKNN